MTQKKRPRLYLVPPAASEQAIGLDRPACPSHLDGLSLESRVLLAMLRLSNHDGPRPLLTQHVLSTLGQVLDCSPHRLITIDALNTINDTVLVKTHRRLDICSTTSMGIAPDEALYIDSITRLASGKYNEPDLPLASVMSEQNLSRFCRAAEHTTSTRSMLGLRRSSALRNASLPLSSVIKCQYLRLSELVVLSLIRLWVRGVLVGFDSAAAVRLLSAHLGLTRLGDTINTLMHRVATSAYRLIDVRCICSREVSPDEAHMLVLISALGHGELLEYREQLLNWLEPQWANAIFIQTSDAVLAIGEPVSQLPRRSWDFDLLRTRQQLFSKTGQ